MSKADELFNKLERMKLSDLMRLCSEASELTYTDAEFITFAANNWDTLLRVIELQGEALEWIKMDIKYDRLQDVIIERVDEAQSEILKLLETIE